MFIADALAVGGTRRGNERQIDSIIHLCLVLSKCLLDDRILKLY
jgi:hypothetical protein